MRGSSRSSMRAKRERDELKGNERRHGRCGCARSQSAAARAGDEHDASRRSSRSSARAWRNWSPSSARRPARCATSKPSAPRPRQNLATRDVELTQCVDRNQKLYALNDEILTRFGNRGFWSGLASAEPFTKLKRVQNENLIGEYRAQGRGPGGRTATTLTPLWLHAPVTGASSPDSEAAPGSIPQSPGRGPMRLFVRQASLRRASVSDAVVYSPAARADCTFGTPSGGEPTLQVSLGAPVAARRPMPSPAVSTTATAPAGDAYWTSVGRTSATLLLEIAGFANINSFGIFDSSESVRIGSWCSPGPPEPARAHRSRLRPTAPCRSPAARRTHAAAHFDSAAFGFYLRTRRRETRCTATRHSTRAASIGCTPICGNGARFISGPITARWRSQQRHLRHRAMPSSPTKICSTVTTTFQDFVVLVRGVQPIPLPAAAWLFGSGIARVAAVARGAVAGVRAL